MVLNKQNISAATQGFRAIFIKELAGGVQPVGLQLAMEVPSSNAVETWGWFEKVSGMKELTGEAKVEDLAAASYTIPNKEWEDTVAIPQADFERDKYGQYGKLIQLMAQGSKAHDSKQIASLLMGGFTNKCYDGKEFFSTAHVYTSNPKVKYSNKLTHKLSSASFEAARALIRKIPNAAGDAMGNGENLVLVVSAKNEGLAKRILEAENNEKGASNVNRGAAKVLVWSAIDLKNEDAWFLVELGAVAKPFVVQRETQTQLIACDDLEDATVMKTHRFTYQAYKRAGYGYALPQYAVGSDGSADAL